MRQLWSLVLVSWFGAFKGWRPFMQCKIYYIYTHSPYSRNWTNRLRVWVMSHGLLLFQSRSPELESWNWLIEWSKTFLEPQSQPETHGCSNMEIEILYIGKWLGLGKHPFLSGWDWGSRSSRSRGPLPQMSNPSESVRVVRSL